MRRAPVTDAISFAERVLALLDEGGFTATYKYAVLLGLLDVSMERTEKTGEPPSTITTRQLAERVAAIYWPHAAPYRSRAETGVLRQNARGQAEILRSVARLRSKHARDPLAPSARIRLNDPEGWERLVRNVEVKLIEMPLPRLQVMGRYPDPFIYEISWDRDVSLKAVRRYQRGERDAFDNRILLLPGVGEYLVQLNGLLRPLTQRGWAARVARWNRLPESRLEDFLFGRDRAALSVLREPLRDLQDGRCFYCERPAGREADVDHFIPWSRYPDDGLDNLVLADRRCNGQKCDFLASARHLRRWCARSSAGTLAELADTRRWVRDREATFGVARAVYLRLPEGSPLWEAGRSFVPAVSRELAGALSAC